MKTTRRQDGGTSNGRYVVDGTSGTGHQHGASETSAAGREVVAFPRGEDRPGRCSALTKLLRHPKTGEIVDILTGHASWEDYAEMKRNWKVYNFPFCEAAASEISFSSYPGAISSTDDFMITKETELAISETSLSGSSSKWGTHSYVEGEKKHVPDYYVLDLVDL